MKTPVGFDSDTDWFIHWCVYGLREGLYTSVACLLDWFLGIRILLKNGKKGVIYSWTVRSMDIFNQFRGKIFYRLSSGWCFWRNTGRTGLRYTSEIDVNSLERWVQKKCSTRMVESLRRNWLIIQINVVLNQIKSLWNKMKDMVRCYEHRERMEWLRGEPEIHVFVYVS